MFTSNYYSKIIIQKCIKFDVSVLCDADIVQYCIHHVDTDTSLWMYHDSW